MNLFTVGETTTALFTADVSNNNSAHEGEILGPWYSSRDLLSLLIPSAQRRSLGSQKESTITHVSLYCRVTLNHPALPDHTVRQADTVWRVISSSRGVLIHRRCGWAQLPGRMSPARRPGARAVTASHG